MARFLLLAALSIASLVLPARAQEIGIESCDRFLDLYQRCVVDKMPAEYRKTYEEAIAAWRKQWLEMAADANSKLILTGACNQIAEQSFEGVDTAECN